MGNPQFTKSDMYTLNEYIECVYIVAVTLQFKDENLAIMENAEMWRFFKVFFQQIDEWQTCQSDA